MNLDEIIKRLNSGGKTWLNPTRNYMIETDQLLNVILVHDKSFLAEPSERESLCPQLNSIQLCRLLANCPGENYQDVIKIITQNAPKNEGKDLCLDAEDSLVDLTDIHYLTIQDISKMDIPISVYTLLDIKRPEPVGDH